MEDKAMHFMFDPMLQDVVGPEPAVPRHALDGRLREHAPSEQGFTIFGLTGRSDTQEEATLGNLAKVGYTPFNAHNFSTKWIGAGTTTQPSYITCAAPQRARPSSTRPAPASTSRRPRLRHRAQRRRPVVRPAGWVRRQGAQAAQPDLLPAEPRTSTAPPARTRFFAPYALHHEAGRLERCHRGRRGHPQHRLVKSTIRTYYSADTPASPTRPTRPTSASWRS